MWQSQFDPVYIEANGTNTSAAVQNQAAADSGAEETKQPTPAGDKSTWYQGSV